jgi:hypothetical protein
LRPNHSQTINLGFKVQPRNPRSSSPRARCRPHTAPPDLSIARPPSTRPVRPSPVLYTRSPTPAVILIAACHAAPAPTHHETRKHDSPNETKVKEKQNKTVPELNSTLAKSMTRHNQTKELTTWFLNLHLDESIDNKSIKFEVRIQDPMKHS